MARRLNVDFEILPRVVNVPSQLRNPPKWLNRDLKVVKYIDDALILEKLKVADQPLLDHDGRRIRVVKAIKSGQKFDSIAGRARHRGMKVNEKKTAVLCLSDALTFSPEA